MLSRLIDVMASVGGAILGKPDPDMVDQGVVDVEYPSIGFVRMDEIGTCDVDASMVLEGETR